MSAFVAEAQVAETLGITTKAVRLRAVKDGWAADKKTKQGGSEVSYFRDLLPVKVREGLVARQAVTGAGVPAVVTDTPIPERSKEIGLAKYNLIHSFRIAKDKAGHGQKGQAAEAFMMAYNAGVLLPQVYSVVGEIRVRTLEALDKKLRSNNDNYLALCDGRGGWKMHGTNKYKGRKLSETAKEVFLKCYLHGARPSVKMAIRMAQMTLEKMGKPEPATDSTWRRWLKDYEKFNAGLICLAREGMKAYQDKYAPYITRDPSLLEVGQCLVADGKVLNFFIKHPVTGQPCRMTLIVFLDWKSRYPCGWHIMPTENQWGVLSAFRNAVVTLGKYPESVYIDNGRAFKSKLFTNIDPDFEELSGIYYRLGIAYFLAKPYNGRTKVVERFNGTIQSQLEWIMPSYCGDSIQTKPPWMHRNEKFQKAWHEARTKGWVPTIREAGVIIDRYFQWYAQQLQEDLPACPADMFFPHQGPGIDPARLNYDFLWRIKVRPRKCRIRLWKVDYESDCLHNLSDQLTIYAAVNTADLRVIWCYTLDGIYLGEAYPVEACHPLARLFGDQVALDQVIEANKRQARLARENKRQLENLGITKDAPDSADILPFTRKTPVLPGPDATANKTKPQEPEKISEEEAARLSAAVEKAEAEMARPRAIPRPKYWSSELEHYEWCFKVVHEHERDLDAADSDFMTSFEGRPEFEQFRQRFEDLKLIYS